MSYSTKIKLNYMFSRTFVKFYGVIGNGIAKKQPIHDKFAPQGANLITFEAFDLVEAKERSQSISGNSSYIHTYARYRCS